MAAPYRRRKGEGAGHGCTECEVVARIAAGAAWRSRKSISISCTGRGNLHSRGRRHGRAGLPGGGERCKRSLATPGRRMLVLYQLAWRET
jgi:hypothetical protein